MLCPECGTDEQQPGGFCTRCNHRLFAWLGDPFGGLERDLSTPIVQRQSVQARQAISGSKLIAGIVAVAVVSSVSSGWAVILLVTEILMIWRRPGVRWLTWTVLLVGVFLFALVWRRGT
jgi:hypothetical protein